MDVRLPIPNNWQDFETICLRLWQEIWNDPNAQKNGRQGQSQNGVDIFGKPIYSNQFHGVQCKDRDGRLGSKLTDNLLRQECAKARSFSPPIESFTIATTCPRDEHIQSFARELTQKAEFPFQVQVWAWDDIEAELVYRPLILKSYYQSTFLREAEISEIGMNRYTSKDNLYAFFSRPIFLSSSF